MSIIEPMTASAPVEVEIAAKLPQVYPLKIGIDEKLVSVDRKAPMAGAEHIHQRVDPSRRIDVFSEMRSFGVEAVAVRLFQDQLTRAVRRTIVQEEKPIDAKAAVMVEEMRQQRRFVAQSDKAQDLAIGYVDLPIIQPREMPWG